MIRVLSLVSYPILPAKTGGQRSITLFNKYFARYVDLICVSTRNNDVSLAEGYQVFNILSDSPARYINIFYFFTLRRLIRRHGITHLLLEHPYYGWLGVMLKWFCGVQLIVRSQNIEGLRWKTLGKPWWKILWFYEKWVHRQARYNFFIQASDLAYAVKHFRLQQVHCALVTYGIERSTAPTPAEKKAARAFLLQKHGIPPTHQLLLFNGSFNYLPNLNALKRILYDINPVWAARENFSYTILICGKDIPAAISQQAFPRVIFAGFVEEVEPYFTGADIFINPVTEGGGIKTKLVEALGHNMNAVSVSNGAIGVDAGLCNGKLVITADNDLAAFAKAVIGIAGYQADISAAFFDHFYWQNIARRAAGFITTP